MTRIGVTGHMNLSAATVPLVREAIKAVLAPHRADGLVGVSCIAQGADSIFAEAVLDLGGALEVVIPAADYRSRKVQPEHAELFDELSRRAATVRVMPFERSGRDAYVAANEALLASLDRLVAVWDGLSPVDKGGTAAVVQDARERGIPVEVVWPEGARRD